VSGSGLLLALALAIGADRSSVPVGGRVPECRGLSARVSWSGKILDKHTVRFTFDGSGIDTCTTYFDLEFVAELFDAHDNKISARRFSVPQSEFTGPIIKSFDYTLKDFIKRIKLVSLHCKVRRVGGLPGVAREDSDPVVEEAWRIAEKFKDEKKTYSQWSDVAVDYSETAVLHSNRTICDGGDQRAEAIGADRSPCEKVRKAVESMTEARAKAYGEALRPQAPVK
jgi:hypothetical protein